ncbi:MAG: S-layer homology domain-containing protein, partial [Candidatus Gracilibacteria bacterium]
MRVVSRKFVSMLLILAIGFVGGAFSMVAFAGSFPDVPEDHVNYKAIQYLKDHGYIGGYGDLTFKPENEINRAEATRIIVSALNIAQDNEAVVLFGDVPKDQWFFPYVMGAYKAGIVSGDDDGKFRPGDTINLAESLRIVSEALKIELP